MGKKYVIGVDYGTDSCRALVVDPMDGTEMASAVCNYPRWKEGMYCDPARHQYRQHPLDYTESLVVVIGECLNALPADAAVNIAGISFDTTGSTPVIIDEDGLPLALRPEFSEEPDAMFVLWKDHTAIAEADHINKCSRQNATDYTAYSGGTYSAEWVWSKVLHILRRNKKVRDAAYAWVEHCDWMGALLTGNTLPPQIKRSRCTAGHKAMWNARWGGYPPEEFLSGLDPTLKGWHGRLTGETYTNGTSIGTLNAEWAARLGLPEGIAVGAGALDAHIGAIGAGITPNVLTRIMGTSTCDILVCEHDEIGDNLIHGICGQVDGSVLPGKTGLEAGQSAFGDVYAWLKGILAWSLNEFVPDPSQFEEKILPRLNELACRIGPGESSVLALDWLNGRRTPDADLTLKGVISGITLGTTPAMIFRALVEATAFGSKAIVDRFVSEGVNIDSIIAIGGIAQKSPLVMQILADVLDKPIKVVRSEQACALGAAMCAAAAAGIHPSLESAQKAMAAPVSKEYIPVDENVRTYAGLYEKYLKLGSCSKTLG